MKRIVLICTILMLAASVWAADPVVKRKKGRPHGFLSGTVLFGGKPISGLVSFFNILGGPPPNEGVTRRIPQRVGKVDGEGRFRLAVPPGTYYIGAMEATADRSPGPPRQNEKFIFAMDNDKNLLKFTVGDGEDKDVGMITAPLTAFEGMYEDYFTIRGTVFYENKEPFPGALVMVKMNIKNVRPLFISERTGSDGRYELLLPPSRGYYVLARQTLASSGRPGAGSYMGTYGEDQPKTLMGQSAGKPALTVSAQKGEIVENVDIVMFKIPSPEEESVKRQTEAGASQIKPVDPRKGQIPGSPAGKGDIR